MDLPGHPNLSTPICPPESYFRRTSLGVYVSNMLSTPFTRLHSKDCFCFKLFVNIKSFENANMI